MRYLTIDRVLEKLKDQPVALRYLPDEPRTHVTREYLYTVVNTLDCSFLPAAQKEIEQQHLARLTKKEDKTIAIDEQILSVIEDFAKLNVSRSSKSSLGGITGAPRKRARK